MVALGIMACMTFTLFWGKNPFSATMMPRGRCEGCCPINEKEDIAFFSYSRNNPFRPRRIYIGDDVSLRGANMMKNLTTVIYVHGFTEQGNSKGAETIKKAYLHRGGVNIIIVDWSPLCAFPWYSHAVLNTRIAAKYLAKFIEYLVSRRFYLSKIHLIGFSLGAEIAGFTGKNLKIGKLPRITGLDPAFPLYMWTGKMGHLTPSDAEFVDVIHTDGGVFGFPVALGHADFFPNGGFPLQPGCTFRELSKNNLITRIMACSHDRAWEYFAESVVNPIGFPSLRCINYESFTNGTCFRNFAYSKEQRVQYMGLAVNKQIRGQFYLATKPTAPFAYNKIYKP
ncbi:pancreatic triacylglycerol lipase isoform X1 [Myzus persicae]|uniref:pancreatic triacylglycerol lipase isoform X1 n=1 Tax=Myzus persicae TaxID=13164 RepID=UPI000B930DF7|nr:pancreatic triacylglycerol lipase isoform X1 [Myzus persicae]